MFRKLRTRLDLLRRGLYSKPLKEAAYETTVAGRPITLFHSRFNHRWLRQLKITPQVILDLGSYDGGDALRLSQAFPEARVITVEADPNRFTLVDNNLQGSDVQLLNYAACEQDGPIPWFSATCDGAVDAQGSLYQHTESYKEQFEAVKQEAQASTVEGTRLDSLCSRFDISQIDFLHMDIEGAEFAALRSLGPIRPQAIYLEMVDNRFVGSSTNADTHNLLISMGYQIAADLGSDRLYVNHTAAGHRDLTSQAA